ncbi:hypothetical protein BUALT_Bualt17G0048200 [Buddleja alternifolia]|uniref:Peptidase C1A papain C-terminal domain-containing protein n=1 Tax=Buddleja alternifolia TaxID=168488 RepID=A0AAV6W6A0_9LAMI|nr:hypothetical protein BUALT_Bualt17G0048200 [Buddleja alternifolia]
MFKANAIYIHNFNKKDKSYKLKLNKFGDITSNELRTMYSRSRIKHHRMLQGGVGENGTFMYKNVHSVPSSIYWREKGAVTDVKDQGQDCGCDGGLMEPTFKYITNKGGITTEKNYPYTGVEGKCDAKMGERVEWGEKGYIRMQRRSKAKEGLCSISMEDSCLIKKSLFIPKDEL